MKSCMWVSPWTYSKLKDKKAYFYTYPSGKKIKLPLEIIVYASDSMGYVIVKGTYKGAYKLCRNTRNKK